VAESTFVLIVVPAVVIVVGAEQSVESTVGKIGSVTGGGLSVPACSENPTTATTPAFTMLISLVNVTVIVDWEPVTVGKP